MEIFNTSLKNLSKNKIYLILIGLAAIVFATVLIYAYVEFSETKIGFISTKLSLKTSQENWYDSFDDWKNIQSSENINVSDSSAKLSTYTTSAGSAAINRDKSIGRLSIITIINANPEETVKEDGFIAQWQIYANGYGQVKLKIFRDTGEKYVFVDESQPKLVKPGLNTFTANIPVEKGDILGVAKLTRAGGIDYSRGDEAEILKISEDITSDEPHSDWIPESGVMSLGATVTSYNQNGNLTSVAITPDLLSSWDKVNITGGQWEIFQEPPEIVSCLKEYKGKLYAGTGPFDFTFTEGGLGGKIYEYDGVEWKLSFDASVIDLSVDAIYDFEIFNGKLYAGAGNRLAGKGGQNSARVYQYDGSEWIEVGKFRECRVDTLEVFNNELYIGTGLLLQSVVSSEYGNGAIYKWHTNENKWERVFYPENKKGKGELCAVYTLKVYNNRLWAGTGCSGQMWYSPDGKIWNLSIDTDEHAMGYDMEIFNNELYVATGNLGAGMVYVYNGTDWRIDLDCECRAYHLKAFQDRLYLGHSCSDFKGYSYGNLYMKNKDGWHFEVDTHNSAISAIEIFKGSLLAVTTAHNRLFPLPNGIANNSKIFIFNESPDWTFKLLDFDSSVIEGYEDLEAIGWDISGLSPEIYNSIKLYMEGATSDACYSFNLYDWGISWIADETLIVGCTDTDNGNNIYEKGTTCRPSTVNDSLFCRTDECAWFNKKVKEYYCDGDAMVSQTIACANGCVDGACKQEQEFEQPVCGNGICEIGETPENCPEDCKENKKLSADLNCDEKVNLVDMAILLSWWRKDPFEATDINQDGIIEESILSPCKNPDINQDGKINLVDFGIMLSQWTTL